MPDQVLLDAIATYEVEHGNRPTVRDVARELGAPVSTAHERIKRAAVAGEVAYDPGIPRSLTVVGSACRMCGR
jgi:DNA-binding IclR family transcriptional regulator